MTPLTAVYSSAAWTYFVLAMTNLTWSYFNILAIIRLILYNVNYIDTSVYKNLLIGLVVIGGWHYMYKIFQLGDCGHSLQRVLGHNFVSHWCIHQSCCPWYHQSFFYLLSSAPIQHCRKTVVYSSFTFVLVEASKTLWLLSNLPLFVCSNLFFSLVSSLV